MGPWLGMPCLLMVHEIELSDPERGGDRFPVSCGYVRESTTKTESAGLPIGVVFQELFSWFVSIIL